jgi:hypothetical protein
VSAFLRCQLPSGDSILLVSALLWCQYAARSGGGTFLVPVFFCNWAYEGSTDISKKSKADDSREIWAGAFTGPILWL